MLNLKKRMKTSAYKKIKNRNLLCLSSKDK